MKTVPTIDEFKNAKEIVEGYEKRQNELQYVKNELAFKLKDFDQIKFKVDKKRNEIVFAGVYLTNLPSTDGGKLKIATTYCSGGDVFDVNIGKLIAVKKALGEDISKVVELVEKKHVMAIGGIMDSSFFTTGKLVARDETAISRSAY